MRKREKEKQKAPSPMRLQGKTDKFRLHTRKNSCKGRSQHCQPANLPLIGAMPLMVAIPNR